MRLWQRSAGIFLLVVSAIVIQQSVHVLRLFDAGQPGSGFMPFGLWVILAVLSVLLILTHLGPEQTEVRFLDEGWLRPIVALAIMAAFTVGFTWLGAVLSVVLLVVAWLLILERKSVLISVVTGAGTGAVIYFLFEVALRAPFPRGVLFGG